MKILFIGGTGVISSACSKLALDRGFELHLLNRGKSARPVPQGAQVIQADIRDRTAVAEALQSVEFDAVVDWVAFEPDHIAMDIAFFRERAGQYVFISSASCYQTPPSMLPVTESTPLDNPYWEYSRRKIACEQRLMEAYNQEKFPVTIVRPSHTYDKTAIPIRGRYTVIDRMRKGKKVVVHGDGASIWTLTHHKDFAKGFVGLLGNPRAIGQAFHITSDEWLTWNQIYESLASAAGVAPSLVHVPSEMIAAYDPEWGASLLGDKAHSMIFDNSKIKRLAPGFVADIPFAQGAREILEWHNADPERQVVDPDFNALLDRMIAAQEGTRPEKA